ncbi:MAG: hypothetical protein LH654_09130, partial [Thermoleophilia bacterium]|nr:hypothetical protein [Thermoleophilia bacterium]
ARVTERYAALHAPGPLLAQLDERQRPHELADVMHPFARVALERFRTVELEEGTELAHYLAASVSVVKNPPPPAETG